MMMTSDDDDDDDDDGDDGEVGPPARSMHSQSFFSTKAFMLCSYEPERARDDEEE